VIRLVTTLLMKRPTTTQVNHIIIMAKEQKSTHFFKEWVDSVVVGLYRDCYFFWGMSAYAKV